MLNGLRGYYYDTMYICKYFDAVGGDFTVYASDIFRSLKDKQEYYIFKIKSYFIRQIQHICCRSIICAKWWEYSRDDVCGLEIKKGTE